MLTSGLHIDQAPPISIPFRFFATGPIFLILAGMGILFWRGHMQGPLLVAETVTIVHLLVLGWLTMTMFGALYQMIPVLAAIRVPWLGLAVWVHGAMVVGVLGFAAAIGLEWHRWFLLVASAGLGIGIVLFLIPILTALLRVAANHPTVAAMRLAAIALAVTLGFGGLFLGEYAHGFFGMDRQAMVGVHLIFGLFGWIGLMILGVSFQVLPMFYTMPLFPTGMAKGVLAGLVLSMLAMMAALLWPNSIFPPTLVLAVAALPGLAAMMAYGITLGRMIRQRKRRIPDISFRLWQISWVAGPVAILLLASWPFLPDARLRLGFGVWFLLGWAGSVLIAMLYKIIPFLVWFHRFSRLAGLMPIPMMDDLLPENLVRWHWLVQLGILAGFSLDLLTGWQWLSWVGGGGMILSGGMLLYAISFALGHVAPEVPEVTDFAAFFKDLPPPMA